MKGFIMIYRKKNILIALSVLCISTQVLSDVKVETKTAASKNVNDALDTLSKDAGLKVGMVSSFDCMGKCKLGDKARKEMAEEQEVLVKGYQAKQKELDDAVEQFKSKAAMLSEEARQSEEKRVMKMKRDLEELGQEAQQKLQMVMQRKTESLAKEFEESVVAYGEKEKFDFIFDQSGRVVYAAPSKNITSEIVVLLDKKADTTVEKDAKKKV